jgi:hypothetical protein
MIFYDELGGATGRALSTPLIQCNFMSPASTCCYFKNEENLIEVCLRRKLRCLYWRLSGVITITHLKRRTNIENSRYG